MDNSPHEVSTIDSHEITLNSLSSISKGDDHAEPYYTEQTSPETENQAYASAENAQQDNQTYHTYYTSQPVYQTTENDAAQVYQTVYPTPDRSSSEDSEEHEDRKEQKESENTQSAHPDMASIAYISSQNGPEVVDGISMELDKRDLWRTFYRYGTEMIITKVGRRMFPSMKVSVNGLDPQKMYAMILDILPVDDSRYRYVYNSSKWVSVGNADTNLPERVYVHPESPQKGSDWMRSLVNFDKLKLTNNENDTKGQIILHSMHKYQPRVHVVEIPEGVDVCRYPTSTFTFREAQFITVTAYQNQAITKLKINRNPFAKGFRNNGRNAKVHNAYEQSGSYAAHVAWRERMGKQGGATTTSPHPPAPPAPWSHPQPEITSHSQHAVSHTLYHSPDPAISEVSRYFQTYSPYSTNQMMPNYNPDTLYQAQPTYITVPTSMYDNLQPSDIYAEPGVGCKREAGAFYDEYNEESLPKIAKLEPSESLASFLPRLS
ncbi:unnamed protein product [Oikopleura dioica]|uniref:T-box domain-containing protein n=1 Tax=Oikopleura dioica TaxID=34765 RepID=E4YZ33_OIKDI|nr:unnamed protein product [Oikopleura dioica]